MKTTTEPQARSLEEFYAQAVGRAVRENLHLIAETVQPRLMNLEQAARYLGMTEEAIRVKVRKGGIPHVRIDRHLRFDRLDLDKYVESHRTVEE